MERIIELNQEDKRVYPLSHSEGVLLSNTSEISLFESIYGLKDMVKLFSGSDITDFSNTTWIRIQMESRLPIPEAVITSR